MLSKACVNILALNMEKVFTIFVEYLANCGASSISNIFPHLDEYATEPKKHYHKQWKNNKKNCILNKRPVGHIAYLNNSFTISFIYQFQKFQIWNSSELLWNYEKLIYSKIWQIKKINNIKNETHLSNIRCINWPIIVSYRP